MIIGINGNLGNGKTATMARLAYHFNSLCEKCNGIINPKGVIDVLWDGWIPGGCTCETPEPHRIHANFWLEGMDFHYVTQFEDVEKVFKGFAFYDELYTWIDSRVSGFSDMNQLVTSILHKSRKRGYNIVYEVKLQHMIDRRIRELTDYVLEPHKFIEVEGELINIDQHLLYPFNLDGYINKTWIVVNELSGVTLETIHEGYFQFALSEVIDLYDTREEIAGLDNAGGGLEKGIKIEDAFIRALLVRFPAGVITQGRFSRGWDVVIENEGEINCFDVVTIRKPRRGGRKPTVDVREKRISELLQEAKEKNMKPWFGYSFQGAWYIQEMLEKHGKQQEITCSNPILLDEFAEKEGEIGDEAGKNE